MSFSATGFTRRGKDDGLRNWHLAGKGQERVSANELDPGMFCWGGIRAKETVQETIRHKAPRYRVITEAD